MRSLSLDWGGQIEERLGNGELPFNLLNGKPMVCQCEESSGLCRINQLLGDLIFSFLVI